MSEQLENLIQASLTRLIDSLAEEKVYDAHFEGFVVDFGEGQDLQEVMEENAGVKLLGMQKGFQPWTDSKTWHYYQIGLLCTAVLLIDVIAKRRQVVSFVELTDCIKDYVRLHVVRRNCPGYEPLVRLNKRDRQRIKRFAAHRPFIHI